MNVRYEREAPIKRDFVPQTKIIWHPDEVKTYYDRPKNSLCLFRKKFVIEKPLKSATVRVLADSRYNFYVNGVRAGRGPSRSDPRWKLYDILDITDLLHEGENLFSASVLYYGVGTGHSVDRIPAFFAETKLTYHDDSEQIVSTDNTWKAYISKMLDRTAPRVNGCKGPIEVWDLRESVGFTAMDFDDSEWENAKDRDAAMSPFWNLYPRQIPNLKETYIPARAVVGAGTGKAEKNITVPEMHLKIKRELDNLTPTTMYVLGVEGELSIVDKDEFNYVIIDFEKVLSGYISIECEGYAGDVVDLVFAEELIEGKPVFNNISYRPFTRFILNDGYNKLEGKFNYEAFRYVYVIVRNHIRKFNLKKAGIIERSYPMEKQSSFSCANTKLQKIWDISLHTLKLCMQDGFLDSPSREQQQWMGDGRFQAIMNYYISGDCRMHEKLLWQISQSQDAEGMTCSRYPDENHNLPPIPSFCLQWICSFGDYYDFTGKTTLIKMLWNSVISGMRWFSGFENADGLLENVPYWQYYDMSKDENGNNADFSRGGINGLINMMYKEAMDTVIRLAEVTGDNVTAKFFKAKRRKLSKNIKKQLWNKEKGAYCDCVVNGEMSGCVSEAVNAMAIIAVHEKGERRVKQIIKNVFDPATRMDGLFKVSPYFMLPYYRALKKAARNDIAISETEVRYSKMVDFGATSTWEHWNLTEISGFMHSCCHAWAAAPIVMVAENLLGIENFGKSEKANPKTGIGDYSAQIVTLNGTYNVRVETDNIKKNSKE